MKNNFKAGFIGCGNMGGVLAAVAAKSMVAKAAECEASGKVAEGVVSGEAAGCSFQGAVYVADHNASKTARLAETFGCKESTAEEIAKTCDLIFLGVKPQVMPAACAQIKDILAERMKSAKNNEDHFCVVSMAAGIKIASYKDYLGDVPFIRIMPNTPCATGAGVILYTPGELATAEDEAAFVELMRPAGIIERMAEAKIDAGCAVTGCGPAFVYMFIDAFIDGAVRAGLPGEQAKRFAIQTVLGSAMMCAQNGAAEPAKLKADVCSPAGSTIEGVAVLEEYSFRSAVMEAVKAAYDRTVELGK